MRIVGDLKKSWIKLNDPISDPKYTGYHSIENLYKKSGFPKKNTK